MAWGVGKQYKSRGVLLLLAPKDGDSQLRVTEALNEFALDDAEAQKILEANGVPQWKDRHWGAGVFGSISRLQGDAASSPITEDKSQVFFGAVVLYRFGNAPGLQDSGGFVYGGQ